MNAQSNSSPVVSVITVVYNAIDSIEKTILSVINQCYKNFEYIIIDGESYDGTITIIKKYESNLNFLLIQRDSGIYDAMNKGIDVAKGDYIIFVNSGDCFYSNDVLDNVFNRSEDSIFKNDLIFGQAAQLLANGKTKILNISRNLNELWKGPIFRHNALFTRSAILKEYKFRIDEKIKFAADYDFIYRCYKDGKKFHEVNEIIVSFEDDGVSGDVASCIKNNYYVVKSYQRIDLRIILYYAIVYSRALLVKYFRRVSKTKI